MHLHGGDRDRLTTWPQDSFISLQTQHSYFKNDSSLQNAPSVRISRQTIRNRLHNVGLRVLQQAIHVQMLSNYILEILNLAQDHPEWTEHNWTPIFFAVEYRLCVDFTDRQEHLEKTQRERCVHSYIAEHDHYRALPICGQLYRGKWIYTS